MPVIKISSNSELFARMGDDLDLDAGRVVRGAGIAEVGRELVGLLLAVVNGRKTKAELNLNDLVAVHTLGPAF